MSSAPDSSESVRDELRKKLTDHNDWDIRAVEATASTAELAYGDIGEERATIEVIRGNSVTNVYLHHIDCPTGAARTADDDRMMDIPGQLAALTFSDFESAVEAVQVLLDMENYDDLAGWILENDVEETAIKQQVDQY